VGKYNRQTIPPESGVLQALGVAKLLMLLLKLQRKPAEAGIAGLSVRAFKPTGLQPVVV